MESASIASSHSRSVSWRTCCVIFLSSPMVPLSLERREPPKITGSGGSSLAVQLGFLLQLLLILPIVFIILVGLLLAFAPFLFLLVSLFSDLFKLLLTLRF